MVIGRWKNGNVVVVVIRISWNRFFFLTGSGGRSCELGNEGGRRMGKENIVLVFKITSG